jgi:hypothetical protein
MGTSRGRGLLFLDATMLLLLLFILRSLVSFAFFNNEALLTLCLRLSTRLSVRLSARISAHFHVKYIIVRIGIALILVLEQSRGNR